MDQMWIVEVLINPRITFDMLSLFLHSLLFIKNLDQAHFALGLLNHQLQLQAF